MIRHEMFSEQVIKKPSNLRTPCKHAGIGKSTGLVLGFQPRSLGLLIQQDRYGLDMTSWSITQTESQSL